EALGCTRPLDASPTGAPCERRANKVSESLQNIDAHGARAADAITRDAIERLGDLLVDRNRGASASGKLLDGFELFAFDATMFECPELRRQDPRRGLGN